MARKGGRACGVGENRPIIILPTSTHRSLPSSTSTPSTLDDPLPAGAGGNGSGLLATLTHGSASCDYVVDAQWCPTHPAAFASATAGGAVHLWDLGRSMEVGGFSFDGYIGGGVWNRRDVS